jgi:hypothetical protein
MLASSLSLAMRRLRNLADAAWMAGRSTCVHAGVTADCDVADQTRTLVRLIQKSGLPSCYPRCGREDMCIPFSSFQTGTLFLETMIQGSTNVT